MINWISCCCRSQTTKGIWIAKCTGIEPCTIAMDLEGTDGRERGEVINSILDVSSYPVTDIVLCTNIKKFGVVVYQLF